MTSATAPARAAEAVAAVARRLGDAGCDSPRLDAELLVAAALGVDRTRLLLEPRRELDPEAAGRLDALAARRAEREPIAYILGRRGFRAIELSVDPRVLIPRPETELLVELAAALAPRGGTVHDLGTGSGAIAAALACERTDLRVSASDASAAALEVAVANAEAIGVAVSFSHARGLPAGSWDLVVANLPYVRADEWTGLAPEITRYEPRGALVAGEDGLDAIRELVDVAAPGQQLLVEHAPGQAAQLRGLLAEAATHRDLAGHERATVGRRPA